MRSSVIAESPSLACCCVLLATSVSTCQDHGRSATVHGTWKRDSPREQKRSASRATLQTQETGCAAFALPISRPPPASSPPDNDDDKNAAPAFDAGQHKSALDHTAAARHARPAHRCDRRSYARRVVLGKRAAHLPRGARARRRSARPHLYLR